jgi:hypothetical protein
MCWVIQSLKKIFDSRHTPIVCYDGDMKVIRITRGVPRFNIQIGPVSQALNHNPTCILSVTDYYETAIAQFPNYHWIPVNEVSQSWGYLPFYAAKRILDFHCLDLGEPLMFVGCTAGKHRSPMMAFCWLMSLPSAALDGPPEKFGGASPETVGKEFYGSFKDGIEDGNLVKKYYQDVKLGYIPDRLPEMYQLMRQLPSASYRDIMHNMCLLERITYPET